jgi:hypothetical protein
MMTYNVCVEICIDVTRQHMKTGPLKIECFEVANPHERGRRNIVVGDVHSTAGYATVGARLGRSGRLRVGGVEDAEVLGDTAITPDVAASFEWTWIELINLGHIARFSGTGHSRATRCEGIDRWHWR